LFLAPLLQLIAFSELFAQDTRGLGGVNNVNKMA